jgi:hypothetical protein
MLPFKTADGIDVSQSLLSDGSKYTDKSVYEDSTIAAVCSCKNVNLDYSNIGTINFNWASTADSATTGYYWKLIDITNSKILNQGSTKSGVKSVEIPKTLFTNGKNEFQVRPIKADSHKGGIGIASFCYMSSNSPKYSVVTNNSNNPVYFSADCCLSNKVFTLNKGDSIYSAYQDSVTITVNSATENCTMNVCGKYFHTFFNYDGLSAYATNKYSDNGIRTVNIETLVQ